MTFIQRSGAAAGCFPPKLCGELQNSKRANNKRNKWLSGQRQRQSRKHFSWGAERERGRWSDGGGGERRGEGIHHLVQRSISFAWFILSKAPPPMQMTHKVEIERLWSWCQEWIYTGLPGRACCSKSFSIRWHFQYRAADLQILKLLLPPHPPQSWKQACSSAALLTRLPLSSSPFHPRFTLFFLIFLYLKVCVKKIFRRKEGKALHVNQGRFAIHFKFSMSLSGQPYAPLKQMGFFFFCGCGAFDFSLLLIGKSSEFKQGDENKCCFKGFDQNFF